MILTIAAMISNIIALPAFERGHMLPSVAVEPIITFYLTSEDEIADSSMIRFLRAGGDAYRFAYSAELQHHISKRGQENRSSHCSGRTLE